MASTQNVNVDKCPKNTPTANYMCWYGLYVIWQVNTPFTEKKKNPQMDKTQNTHYCLWHHPNSKINMTTSTRQPVAKRLRLAKSKIHLKVCREKNWSDNVMLTHPKGQNIVPFKEQMYNTTSAKLCKCLPVQIFGWKLNFNILTPISIVCVCVCAQKSMCTRNSSSSSSSCSQCATGNSNKIRGYLIKIIS